MDISANLKIAIQAAIEAGEEILKIYNEDNFEVAFKEDKSPLTSADKASHLKIVSFLKETSFPILSEEGRDIAFEERKHWETLWIVDPIDGTKEFIKRNGEFTVNIALVSYNVPVLGVIYVPVLKDLYFAEKNLGCFKLKSITSFSDFENRFDQSFKLPLEQKERPYQVVASKSHLSPETEDFIENLKKNYPELQTISKGSSLKLCMVAEGIADCYPRFAPTMEWDTAAGQAICMYAGKTVIDYTTKKEMLYNREKLLNNWFLVS